MGILPIRLIEEDATLMRNNLGSIIQKKKKKKWSQVWWLMHIIPNSQEVEAAGLLWIWDWHELYSKQAQASLDRE